MGQSLQCGGRRPGPGSHNLLLSLLAKFKLEEACHAPIRVFAENLSLYTFPSKQILLLRGKCGQLQLLVFIPGKWDKQLEVCGGAEGAMKY